MLDGLGRFPVNAPVDFTAPLPGASGKMPDARALFDRAGGANKPGRFKLSADPPRLAEDAKPGDPIKKYLPRSYRESFLFTGPRTDARDHRRQPITAPSRRRKLPNKAFMPSPDTVSWGQVYAYCLRHRQLAEKLGLIREASFSGSACAVRRWRLPLRRPDPAERLRRAGRTPITVSSSAMRRAFRR